MRRWIWVTALGVAFALWAGTGAPGESVGARGAEDEPSADAAAPDTENLELWVGREHPQTKNSLKTRVLINGQEVGTFTGDARQPVGKYLKKGWNNLVLKTTGIDPPEEDRVGGLHFQVGWVSRAEKNRDRMHVLWSLTNAQGWRVKDGKVFHRRGPDIKEVELPFHLNYQGRKHEAARMSAGDVVLQGSVSNQDLTTNIRVTVTVLVNGRPLNTFTRQARQVVITPLLKEGDNEARVITRRIDNLVFDTHNPQPVVVGPVEWSARESKFLLRPTLQIDGKSGWGEDRDSGRLVVRGDPAKGTVERTYHFRYERKAE